MTARRPADLAGLVADYHGAFAGHADAARRVGWRGRRDQLLRFAICCEALDVASLDAVLDVGCGEGDLAPFLRGRGFRGDYLGVDLLPSMVEAARRRHPDERFVQGDLLGHVPDEAERRFDLVVACGTLSLRVPEAEAHVTSLLGAMWQRTAGALVVVVPSARGRKHHLVAGASGDDPFLYYSAEALRRRLAALSPWTAVREDFLPMDVAGTAYRERSPTHEQLLVNGELDAVGVAWLLLERSLPARALEVLQDAPDDDPETWLRRGQAHKRLGHEAAARTALERALALNPRCEEARLELEGC